MKFNFDMMAKADKTDEGLFIEGTASTLDLDADRERMALSALKDMAKAIDVPLTDSHENEIKNHIGDMVASSLEEGVFKTRFKIDSDDDYAVRLWKKVNRRKYSGLSVGGDILLTEPSLAKGEKRIIKNVSLSHIMLTGKPSNPQTMAVAFAKSIADAEASLEKDALTSEDYDKYGTYTKPDGTKAFPMRPGNKSDAENALNAIGRCPPEHRELVRNRACGILGADAKDHPQCGQTSKSKDSNMNETTLAKIQEAFDAVKAAAEGDVLAKQGATHSKATIEKLQSLMQVIKGLIDDNEGDAPNEDGTPVTGAAKVPDVKSVDIVAGAPVSETSDGTEGDGNPAKKTAPEKDDLKVLIKSTLQEFFTSQDGTLRKSLVLKEEEPTPSITEIYAKSTDLRGTLEAVLNTAFSK